MATKYEFAPEVKKIAEELIPKYHPHLITVRIDYVFSDATPMAGGKEVCGNMKKISGLAAFLATPPSAEAGATVDEEGNPILPNNDPFFCLSIAKPAWEVMDTSSRIAEVDKRLCYAGTKEKEDGSFSLVLLRPDVEEFGEIIDRHGMYQSGISTFVERAKRHSPVDDIEALRDTIDAE